MVETKLLTKELAEQFLSNPSSVDLREFTAVEEQASETLAKHKGWLDLNGLTKLSDQAAEALGKREGDLSLMSLTSLSDHAAQALEWYHGSLSLDGLKSLSDAAADGLAHQLESLSLNGLTSLSDQAAEAFGNNCVPYELFLDGLTSLSDEGAEVLAKHGGALHLNGLKNLSDRAAEAFAEHNDWLELNGLIRLSDQAAEALAKHKGGVALEGLTSRGMNNGAHPSLRQSGSTPPDRDETPVHSIKPNRVRFASMLVLAVAAGSVAGWMFTRHGRWVPYAELLALFCYFVGPKNLHTLLSPPSLELTPEGMTIRVWDSPRDESSFTWLLSVFLPYRRYVFGTFTWDGLTKLKPYINRMNGIPVEQILELEYLDPAGQARQLSIPRAAFEPSSVTLQTIILNYLDRQLRWQPLRTAGAIDEWVRVPPGAIPEAPGPSLQAQSRLAGPRSRWPRSLGP